MTTKPRAAVVEAPGEARIVPAEPQAPGRGEVRVRIEASGICGSDLAVWQGRDWFEYPRPAGVPGHEAYGVIDEVGPGVDASQWRTGDRVTGLFERAYATHETRPVTQLMKIPEELGDAPFFGEPLACATNAFRRADIRARHKVAVVGVGFMGALLTGLAASAGAHVIAISRRATSLKAAEQMGAREVIALGSDDEIISEVERLTKGGLCDRVIEATGRQAPLDLATKLTRTRGRLVIAGYHQDGARMVDMQLWNWRGLDVVNAHERDPQVYMQGMRDAAANVAAGKLDPAPLLTHTFPLDRIGEAFQAVQDRPDGFLKAVVRA